MAQSTVASARIAAVLAQSARWTSARRKRDGKPFFYVPGSTDGAVYMTAEDGCTCPAAQRYAGPCKHSLAVAQHIAPKPARRSYATLAPKCGAPDCDDDAGRYGFCYFHKPRQTVAA